MSDPLMDALRTADANMRATSVCEFCKRPRHGVSFVDAKPNTFVKPPSRTAARLCTCRLCPGGCGTSLQGFPRRKYCFDCSERAHKDSTARSDQRRVRSRNAGQCKVIDCKAPAHSRGWCRMHYARWKRNGSPYETQKDQPRRVV